MKNTRRAEYKIYYEIHIENIFSLNSVILNIAIDFKGGRNYCKMEVCPYGYKRLWNLSEWQIHFIQTIDVILLSINIFLNTLVTYLIFRTSQYQKQSFKLMLLVSISSCMAGILGQGSYFLAGLRIFWYLPCPVQFVLESLLTWTFVLCLLVNGLVGVDRFLHIKYTNRYDEVFSRKRFRIVILLIFLISIVEVGLYYISFYLGYGFPLLNLPFSVGIILATSGFQIKSVLLLKIEARAREHLSSSSGKITKLAFRYFVLFLSFVVTGKLVKLTCNIALKGRFKQETLDFAIGLAILYMFSYYPAVAIAFLATNKKSQRYLRKRLRRKTVINESRENSHSSSEKRSRKNLDFILQKT